MGDYFPGEIHIGGPLRGNLLNHLIGAIVAEVVSLENYGGPTATEDGLRTAFQGGAVVHLYDDQASYGQFDELEEFLVRHQIHFDRHSGGRYEYDSENMYYRGGLQPVVMAATESGQPLLHCDEVLAVLDNAVLADQAKLQAIRNLAAPAETAPLVPVSLLPAPERKGGSRPCRKKSNSTSPG